MAYMPRKRNIQNMRDPEYVAAAHQLVYFRPVGERVECEKRTVGYGEGVYLDIMIFGYIEILKCGFSECIIKQPERRFRMKSNHPRQYVQKVFLNPRTFAEYQHAGIYANDTS